MFVVGDVNRGVCPRVWQRPGWCAPGGAGGWCRRFLVGEAVQPLDVGAVLPRGVLPDVLPDQSAQCLDREVFVLRFARRQSCAEPMRLPAEWARLQVRDARAAEPVQLLSDAAAEVIPTKRVAVFVVHLHAEPAWVPRPRMWSFTFEHPLALGVGVCWILFARCIAPHKWRSLSSVCISHVEELRRIGGRVRFVFGCGIFFVVCGVASRSCVVMLCRVGWRWVVWRRVVVALRRVAACAVLFCCVALVGVLRYRALAVPCRFLCCFLLFVAVCSIALCCVVSSSCRWAVVSRVACRCCVTPVFVVCRLVVRYCVWPWYFVARRSVLRCVGSCRGGGVWLRLAVVGGGVYVVCSGVRL